MISRLFIKLHTENDRTLLIKKNILYSTIIKGASILASLIIVPLTLNYVNKELYGIWLTLSSVVFWLNYFDIGLTLGLKNKLAEALATKDFIKGKELVSTTYYMMFLIFFPLCVLVSLLVPIVPWDNILNISHIYKDEIIKVLYILLFTTFFQMFFSIISSVVSAYQKVSMASLFIMLGQYLSLVIIFILTKFAPPSLIGLAFAISIPPIIILIIFSYYLYNNSFKEISPSIKYINNKKIKEVFSIGLKFFIIQIQIIVLYQSTNLIISNISGPSAVTEYNITYKYLSIATLLYNIILTPLWPAFSNAYTLKDYKWMRNIYKKMCIIYGFVAIGICTLIIISPYIYSIWIGNDINISFYLTTTIGIFFLINSWDSLQVSMINGIGAIKLQTYIVIIGLILHIPLAYFFGQKIGTAGVVLSMICINIIYSIFFTIQINKILKNKANGIWIK